MVYTVGMQTIWFKMRMSVEVRRRLKRQAKRCEKSLSALVREYIIDGLEADERTEARKA
jgi:predicted DNA-binding protein